MQHFNFHRLSTLALSGALALSLLAGCGGAGGSTSADGASASGTPSGSTPGSDPLGGRSGPGPMT